MKKPFGLIVFVIPLFLFGCGGNEHSIKDVKDMLRNEPTWSIVLDDMKEEGNFIKSYFHRYRLVQPDSTEMTDWLKVSRNTFMEYKDFLGMAVAGAVAGVIDNTPAPAFMQYVGNPQFGQWRTDMRGNRFWEFYGQYSMLNDLTDGGVTLELDFDDYWKHRKKHKPYYGRNKKYGTYGSYTKKTKPKYYSRKSTRNISQKSSFSSMLGKRVGRSKSGFRGRSGGRGK